MAAIFNLFSFRRNNKFLSLSPLSLLPQSSSIHPGVAFSEFKLSKKESWQCLSWNVIISLLIFLVDTKKWIFSTLIMNLKKNIDLQNSSSTSFSRCAQHYFGRRNFRTKLGEGKTRWTLKRNSAKILHKEQILQWSCTKSFCCKDFAQFVL